MSSTVERIFGDEREKKRLFRRLNRLRRAWPDESRVGMPESTRHILQDDKEFPYTVEHFAPFAESSNAARRLLATALSARRGREALEQGDFRTAATAYGYVYRQNNMVVVWDPSQVPKILQICQELVMNEDEDLSVRADALMMIANVLYFQGQLQDAIDIIRMAQLLLPHDGALHACEGCFLSKKGEASEALSALTRAYQMGYDNIDRMLYNRAILTKDEEQARALFEEYVQRSDLDAQKRPEACYRLVLMHGLRGPYHLGAARRYYELGLQADEARLPFFEDEATVWRRRATILVSKYRACGNPACDVVGTHVCAGCQTVFYCSRDCQVRDRKRHKPECKRIKATL